jgi:hypothetical protein
MSDGGRGRASVGVEGWKSFQEWSVQRSTVRSIAWLGDFVIAVIKDVYEILALERREGVEHLR